MTALDDLQHVLVATATKVGPSVVGLGRGWGLGSGVIVAENRVLTNAHNIRGEEVSVSFHDGRRATGSLAGADADRDVAVVTVETGAAPPLDWEPDATTVGLGSAVLALADPGGRGLRVTHGFVSAAARSFRGPRGRRMTGGVEHTAPMPRGSSGGPLVDPAGRLVGLNTLRLEGGLILALAADAALKARVELLARGEAPAARRLGVAVAPPRAARRMRRAVGLEERDGLLVRAVEQGSAAERAGIERGDLLVSAGGRDLDGVDRLHAVLDDLATHDGLALTVVRGTEERRLDVVFDGSAEAAR